MLKGRRGQVTVEMAVLFAFVVAAFIFMAIYLQRAASGGVKSNSDSLGTQFSAHNPWTSTTQSTSQQRPTQTTTTNVVDYDQTVN